MKSQTKAAATWDASPASVAEGKRQRRIQDKVTVIVTADRKNDLNMTFCGYGRLTKAEITESLHTRCHKGRCCVRTGMSATRDMQWTTILNMS